MERDNQINWHEVVLGRSSDKAFVSLILSGKEEDLDKAFSLREFFPRYFLSTGATLPPKLMTWEVGALCRNEEGESKPREEIVAMMYRLKIPFEEKEVPLKHISKRRRQFCNTHFETVGGRRRSIIQTGEDEWDYDVEGYVPGHAPCWYVLYSSADELMRNRRGRPRKNFPKTEKLLLVSFKHLAKKK